MMSKEQIELELVRQQEIQMANHPSTKAWQDASEQIHKLAEMLTGEKLKDAWGKR